MCREDLVSMLRWLVPFWLHSITIHHILDQQAFTVTFIKEVDACADQVNDTDP